MNGKLLGSIPTGTSLKELSPRIGGFTLLKTSLKLCVIVGAMHDTRHLTRFIFENRVRTTLTMFAPRDPWPF